MKLCISARIFNAALVATCVTAASYIQDDQVLSKLRHSTDERDHTRTGIKDTNTQSRKDDKNAWGYYGNKEKQVTTGSDLQVQRLRNRKLGTNTDYADSPSKTSKAPSMTPPASSFKSNKSGLKTTNRHRFLNAIDCGGNQACIALLTAVEARTDLQDIFLGKGKITTSVQLFTEVYSNTGRLQQFQDAGVQTETIFTGTVEQVIQRCNAQNKTCCADMNVCSWEGVASIGENSCIGMDACSMIPTDTIIFQNSCIGDESCEGVNFKSADAVASFASVGPNSCGGQLACNYVGGSADGYVLIGKDSCNGENSCYLVGAGNAFYYVNGTAPRVSDVVIGDRSCIASSSCSEVNSYYALALGGGVFRPYDQFAGDVTIGDDTCVGISACEYFGFGRYFDSAVVLGDNVCPSPNECTSCQRNVTAGVCALGQTLTVADGGTCPNATDPCV